MKKIVFTEDSGIINFNRVNRHMPIFAREHGQLVGMIVKEEKGWITRIGGSQGATGWHGELGECIKDGLKWGYEYFIEEA